MRYLWWAEFQKRGALHYHAILVDPPFARERDARHWFDKTWRAALPPREHRTQAYVQFMSSDWFRKKGGDYVLKDTRKLAGKTYEQDYTRMPSGWRTFRSHQLAFTAAEHQEHESKAHTVCTAPLDAPWHQKTQEIWIYRVDRHVPARCGCVLYRRKVRRQSAQCTGNQRQKAGQSGAFNQVSPRATNGDKSGQRTWDAVSTGQAYARPRSVVPTTSSGATFGVSTGCANVRSPRSLNVTTWALPTPDGDSTKRGRVMTTPRVQS